MWRNHEFISYWDQPISGYCVSGYFIGLYPAVSSDGAVGVAIAISDEGSTTIIACRWGTTKTWWTNDDVMRELPEDVRECVEDLMGLLG